MMTFKKSTKTIVCIGSGGVGKTTIAASIAMGKAVEGFKVLVLTIDPSLRLAQALNFKPDGELHAIELKPLKKLKSLGHLDAMTINHEKMFHQFLQRAAQGAANAPSANNPSAAIEDNKLFRQLSTRLSGSQDFTTLFALYTYVEKNAYDYIVLDTPPSQHTIQFLSSPETIAQFFDENITKWFRSSGEGNLSLFKKIISTSTNQIIQMLAQLTGAEFMKEFSAFFIAIRDWQEPLRQIALRCQKILSAQETEFLLVTSFDPNQIKLAQNLSRKIYNEGYNLSSVIINQFPEWIDEKNLSASTTLIEHQVHLRKTAASLKLHLEHFHKNLIMYKSLNISNTDDHEDFLSGVYSQISQIT